jgi:hypothetical protein
MAQSKVTEVILDRLERARSKLGESLNRLSPKSQAKIRRVAGELAAAEQNVRYLLGSTVRRGDEAEQARASSEQEYYTDLVLDALKSSVLKSIAFDIDVSSMWLAHLTERCEAAAEEMGALMLTSKRRLEFEKKCMKMLSEEFKPTGRIAVLRRINDDLRSFGRGTPGGLLVQDILAGRLVNPRAMSPKLYNLWGRKPSGWPKKPTVEGIALFTLGYRLGLSRLNTVALDFASEAALLKKRAKPKAERGIDKRNWHSLATSQMNTMVLDLAAEDSQAKKRATPKSESEVDLCTELKVLMKKHRRNLKPNWVAIGKELGVSDKTAKKWAQRCGLWVEKPPQRQVQVRIAD